MQGVIGDGQGMAHFSSILLATDFSERASAAENRISLLATKPASVRLLHVMSSTQLRELQALVQTHSGLDKRLQAATMVELLQQADRLQARIGIKVDTQLEFGRPHVMIKQVAEAHDSLVVIGSHGQHAVKDWFQSSMVEHLLSGTQQPLLVVKQPATFDYRKVLVPVDFSASSAVSIQAAIALAPDSEVTLLHVYDIPFENKLRFAGVSDEEMADYRDARRQQAEEDMTGLVTNLALAEHQIRNKVIYGHAPEVILNEADEGEYDLIVMGRYGKTGIAQLMVGSVAESVVMHCNADILVVTAKDVPNAN